LQQVFSKSTEKYLLHFDRYFGTILSIGGYEMKVIKILVEVTVDKGRTAEEIRQAVDEAIYEVRDFAGVREVVATVMTEDDNV
jgi:hypothetical protein